MVSSSSDNVVSKTQQPTETAQSSGGKQPNKETLPKVVQSGKVNVLNSYRSYTYNFTLAALNKNVVNDPKSYRNSSLDFVIARSGGKGTTGISTAVAGVQRKVGEEIVDTIREGGRVLSVIKKDVMGTDLSGDKLLVEGFNKNSPGRFDLFIENVEIENLMGFSENGSTSLPTAIRFDVIEPYSINGFIEALHVAAVAAGYPTYTLASFLLKMEFWGYPDDSSLPDPEIVPGSTRYFVLGFTGIEVEVTERGTKYRCSAVPFNEKGFGQPSVLKKPTPMAGSTVKEILEDLIKNVNSQVAKADKDSKETKEANKHDVYKVVFPVRDLDKESGWDFEKVNKIGEAKVTELLKDNQLYKFPDPGTSPKTDGYKSDDKKQPSPQQQAAEPKSVAYTYTPGKPQVQFSDGAVIHELISSVIRDSTYVRDKLSNIGKPGVLDEYGYMEYFMVKLKVKNLDTIDETTKKPFQEYTYVVTPYKIHYTRIPGYANMKIDEKKLSLLSLRTYNYIYTGQNVDVLNFKLNFNTLFFEAVPVALGNSEAVPAKTSAAATGNVVPKQAGSTAENPKPDANGQTPQRTTEVANQVQAAGGNAGPVSEDPYAILAKNMHNAIVNSKASMITGEIEILGDPFFLVTGGIGNYEPKPVSRGVAGDNEADHQIGEVLITIIFNNPTDYSTFEDGGLMYFDSQKVPFSGVYRVQKVNSSFKDGVFKQNVEIIRIPGQVDTKAPISDPANKIKTQPNKLDTPKADVTLATAPSQRPSGANLLTQLIRGLPSPGLPGSLSNFIGRVGGLGGSSANLLNQVSGAVTNGIGKLTSAAGVFGGSIPGGVDQLASGIRLNASGLADFAKSALAPAALVSQAANTFNSALPSSDTLPTMANQIIAKAQTVANSISVPGSGIGEGAQIKVDPSSSITPQQIMSVGGTLTKSDVANQTSSVPTNVAAITGIAAGLGVKALGSINNLGSSAAGIVSGVKDKVQSLTAGTASDPTAIAAKFGINPSQLSGLSENLKSRVLDQVNDLAKQIPSNTDLSAATAQGIVLDYVGKDKLKNLPATPSYATAPEPEVDAKFLSDLVAKGGPQALANAFGVSDVAKISGAVLPTGAIGDILSAAPSALNNPLRTISSKFNLADTNAIKDKLLSSGNQLSALTGVAGSVEANISAVQTRIGSANSFAEDVSKSVVSQFGSTQAGSSPLVKLLNGGG